MMVILTLKEALMNILRIAVLKLPDRPSTVTLNIDGVLFTAEITNTDVLQYALSKFPNEYITLLDLTKGGQPQVEVVQEKQQVA